MLRSEERFCAGLRASFFLLCLSLVVLFTPPPRGRGWILGFVLLGFVGFALLVHSWITLAQQGRSGASLVSVSLPCPQNRTQGRVWFSPLFPGALLVRQGCQTLGSNAFMHSLFNTSFGKPHSLFPPPQIFALLTNCAQERDYAVWNGREQEKRRRLASEGSSYHPF